MHLHNVMMKITSLCDLYLSSIILRIDSVYEILTLCMFIISMEVFIHRACIHQHFVFLTYVRVHAVCLKHARELKGRYLPYSERVCNIVLPWYDSRTEELVEHEGRQPQHNQRDQHREQPEWELLNHLTGSVNREPRKLQHGWKFQQRLTGEQPDEHSEEEGGDGSVGVGVPVVDDAEQLWEEDDEDEIGTQDG